MSYNTIHIADYFSLLIPEQSVDMDQVCHFIMCQVAVNSKISRSLPATWKINNKSQIGSVQCSVILRTVDVPKHVVEFYFVV